MTADDQISLRGTPGVARLLGSVFCSSAASLSQATVLGKQVYDLTGSTFALGLVGLAEFMPAALLVLVTGSVADRYDRRRVAAAGGVVQAAVVIALALYATTNPTSALPIFLLVLVFGTGRAFVAPSSRALPADVVSAAQLPRLMARYSMTWQISLIVGPVAGGLLYAAGVWVPYVLEAVLLITAAGLIVGVPVRPRSAAPELVPTPAEVVAEASLEAAVEPVIGHAAAAPASATKKPGVREALEGLRFIKRQPVLLGAISLDLFAVLFGGAVALLPAIAKDRLGVGALGLGWLRAAGGLGAAAVTIALAARPVTRHIGKVLLAVVAAFGVFTIVLGLTRSFLVAFIAMAALSGADAVSVFIRSTLVPLVTPQDKRGRVLAVENVFIGASNELGAFESGVAGTVLGTAGAVVFGGVGTLAVAGLWWMLFPRLRDVDRFPRA